MKYLYDIAPIAIYTSSSSYNVHTGAHAHAEPDANASPLATCTLPDTRAIYNNTCTHIQKYVHYSQIRCPEVSEMR